MLVYFPLSTFGNRLTYLVLWGDRKVEIRKETFSTFEIDLLKGNSPELEFFKLLKPKTVHRGSKLPILPGCYLAPAASRRLLFERSHHDDVPGPRPLSIEKCIL